MQIFYFSGTGNSLHVAQLLQSRFPGAELIPIIRVFKDEKIVSKSEVVGFVFPIHAFTFPWPVKQFLEKVDLSSSKYLFAVATRECFVKTFSDMDKILAKQNRILDAYFSFEMPETYLPLFQMYTKERCEKVEKRMLVEVENITGVISKSARHRSKDARGWLILSHVIYPVITWVFKRIRFPKMETLFYADAACNQCGTCEKVCLAGKIKTGESGPHWDESVRCLYCFSCIHYCPSQAIQIKGRKTIGKGRYHHPFVSVKEISNQK